MQCADYLIRVATWASLTYYTAFRRNRLRKWDKAKWDFGLRRVKGALGCPTAY
jgi:hypothetical protein